jgi:hypothetical protein
MHADLEKIIQYNRHADANKNTAIKLRHYLWPRRLVTEKIKCPEIKDHNDEIGNDPFFLCAQINIFNKLQPPQQENRECGEKAAEHYYMGQYQVTAFLG